jgi:hypothetical protein
MTSRLCANFIGEAALIELTFHDQSAQNLPSLSSSAGWDPPTKVDPDLIGYAVVRATSHRSMATHFLSFLALN